MEITFSEIRNRRLNKNKNNHIFNLLKINNDITGYKREIKYFRSEKKKNIKNINKMIDNIDDLRFIELYSNMMISMNETFENLINNFKNKITEVNFFFLLII